MSVTAEELLEFTRRAESAEYEIHQLHDTLLNLKNGQLNIARDNDVTPALAKLRTANSKLKYQLIHIKRNIHMEEAKARSKHMVSLVERLGVVFHAALGAAYPQLSDTPVAVTPSTNDKFGDYQCNSAMMLANLLKAQGTKVAPRQIADNILSHVSPSPLIGRLEIAGPGFINVHLDKTFIEQELSTLLKDGVRPPHVGARRKVVIDMSSPNIAKEMHVGHLRSTIIGDSIANLCQFVGHEVKKINHLGDWGTQFGMLITHLMDEFPDYKAESPCISDLMAFYRASKKRFDDDEDFKKRAYSAVVKLQSYDADTIAAWTLICNESRKEFMKVYERLSISDLIDRGESFYQPLMQPVVDHLDAHGLTVIEEGRKLVWPADQAIPLTIVKSDGGMTYATSDLAALRQRLHEEQAHWVLYVVDQGQSVHLQSVYSTAAAAGWYDPLVTRVEHVGFGVVLGEDKKKFKTRSGDTVRLVDLLDEGLVRAQAKLIEKERDKELNPEELKAAQEAVAYGCIKYSDLSNNRQKDYVFSFDKMLEDKGNTAVYLLYMYTRIRAICRLAGVTDEQVRVAASTAAISLEHASECKLAKLLLRFPEIILKMMDDLLVHPLCDFLYEVATCFSEFYDHCYVVEKDRQTGEVVKVNWHRLLLCEATARVMATSFNILGLHPVQKM